MLFSPTIGAALAARYWFLWVYCPACRTTQAIDLRTLDRHPDAAVTSLIPALSCRSCRPNARFAELVRLSRKSIADEIPCRPLVRSIRQIGQTQSPATRSAKSLQSLRANVRPWASTSVISRLGYRAHSARKMR